jgi:ankyrin repeat protein
LWNAWAGAAFLEACDRGCAEVFAFLFPLLSDDQIRKAANQQQMTGLLLALRRGDVDMARAFLERGASADGDHPLGPLPLTVAVTVRPRPVPHCAPFDADICAICAHCVVRRSATGLSW